MKQQTTLDLSLIGLSYFGSGEGGMTISEFTLGAVVFFSPPGRWPSPKQVLISKKSQWDKCIFRYLHLVSNFRWYKCRLIYRYIPVPSMLYGHRKQTIRFIRQFSFGVTITSYAQESWDYDRVIALQAKWGTIATWLAFRERSPIPHCEKENHGLKSALRWGIC